MKTATIHKPERWRVLGQSGTGVDLSEVAASSQVYVHLARSGDPPPCAAVELTFKSGHKSAIISSKVAAHAPDARAQLLGADFDQALALARSFPTVTDAYGIEFLLHGVVKVAKIEVANSTVNAHVFTSAAIVVTYLSGLKETICLSCVDDDFDPKQAEESNKQIVAAAQSLRQEITKLIAL